ncbi:MAG: hypothetical protein RLZZ555_274 [Pseudomonadota bacterium]
MAARVLHGVVCPWIEVLQVINDWLRIPYRDHGRDWTGCDCWGLVRLVRHALRGDLLASHGAISPADKQGLTQAAGEVLIGFRQCQPQVGALATVWRSGLCLHVGIVIEVEDRLAVLETGRRIGVRWLRLPDFERAYPDVRFYDND